MATKCHNRRPQTNPMRGSRKFCQVGSPLTVSEYFFLFVFLVDEGRENSNITISGQSSACGDANDALNAGGVVFQNHRLNVKIQCFLQQQS